ncbi:MAG TPA: zf-TFIIB domain-containing protein [Phycisphaerae bacterium]|nr:zf-TFIIB domain-containing protein [Phycisphaerae bacterium]
MMKCPKCNVDLQLTNDRGVEIQSCPNCHGMWFTRSEFDQFEDIAIDPEAKTGSLYIVDQPTELKCPVCSGTLVSFDYRFYDLRLDCCPDHGFWLQAGDDERVLSLMRQEAAALDHKYSVEGKWAGHLRWIQSPTFFSKLKTLFHK